MPSYLRSVRNAVRRRVRRTRHRVLAAHLDGAAIATALARLPIETPARIMVHSSLSACGYIEGGAATVLGCLRSWNRDGTLMMPAHSYCYPSAGRPAPVFDPTATPSVVGEITERFWRQSGVYRSLHPTHSLAVEGPQAETWTQGHESCDTPCGSGTPYQRLVEANCAVLMFGATLDAYTLFHTAEDAAGAAYLYEPEPVRLRYLDHAGCEHSMLMRRQDMGVERAFRQKDSWLESVGLLHRFALGDGELLLVPQARLVHDATVQRLKDEPSFLCARRS